MNEFSDHVCVCVCVCVCLCVCLLIKRDNSRVYNVTYGHTIGFTYKYIAPMNF